VDRRKLRRVDGAPAVVLTAGLVNYLVEDKLLGHQHGGLAAVGGAFLLALVTSWVLRRISGMTWREALWSRRELPMNMASVREHAEAGRKIQAIKIYRELTGADLKAGVEAVDAMARRRSVDVLTSKGSQAEHRRTAVD
jgi:hypothetical protein